MSCKGNMIKEFLKSIKETENKKKKRQQLWLGSFGMFAVHLFEKVVSTISTASKKCHKFFHEQVSIIVVWPVGEKNTKSLQPCFKLNDNISMLTVITLT